MSVSLDPNGLHLVTLVHVVTCTHFKNGYHRVLAVGNPVTSLLLFAPPPHSHLLTGTPHPYTPSECEPHSVTYCDLNPPSLSKCPFLSHLDEKTLLQNGTSVGSGEPPGFTYERVSHRRLCAKWGFVGLSGRRGVTPRKLLVRSWHQKRYII